MAMNEISSFLRGRLEVNADGGVKAPENIITSLPAAYEQYIAMRQDHYERIALYAAVDGMIAGNPPYDEEELRAAGLEHIANFNNFKARANYEKSAQGYWNLINSTEVWVKIKLNPAVAGPKHQRYASIMARHFSDVMKEWEDFAPNFNLLGSQLVKYGLCPVFWPHEKSPLWEVVDVSRFFIPSKAQSFVSKLTTVCVDTTYTVQDLYQIYKGLDDDDDWNKETLGNFLLWRANTSMPAGQRTADGSWNVLDLQRFISTSSPDLLNNYFNDNVRITNLYQVEYEGGVSHYMFSPDFYAAKDRDLMNKKDFLYFVDRQYERMEDCSVIFTASPGEWNIHSNVGVGQKMFAPAQAINMMDCAIVDMSKMAATPLIRTLSAGGRDGSNLRFYPGVATDIGAAEFQQNNLGSNINQLVGASQYLTQGMELNAVNAGDDPGIPDRSQGSISPTEARSRAFTEFGVLKNVVAHFYNTFDKVIRRSFIAFLSMKRDCPGYDLGVEWKRRCMEDGVPKELFDSRKKGLHGLPIQFRSVKASRVAGDGSTLARIMGLEALGPIMGTFNDEEIAAYKTEYVEATVGVDYLDTFASSTAQMDEVSGGVSLAAVENGLFAQGLGQYVKFSPDNEQEPHADEHMAEGARVQQEVSQQKMSPVDADKILAGLIPHLTEHIDYMNKAPQFYREFLNQVLEPFKQLRQWASLNKNNAQRMVEAAIRQQQQDAAKTQETMSDIQRKDMEARADIARKDRDQAAKDARAEKANEVKGDVIRDKTRADIEAKRRKTDAEVAQKQATARGRTELELAQETPDELRARIERSVGVTPSTIDFE